jgi:2-polyprenyl-6-methoxyphenol hydroxylase-like FAD-dependent oxidoreductase
MEILMNI